jgi:hypothetical protein
VTATAPFSSSFLDRDIQIADPGMLNIHAHLNPLHIDAVFHLKCDLIAAARINPLRRTVRNEVDTQ